MSRVWGRGSTRRWRKIRTFVLTRDSHTCQVRVRTLCTDIATAAHHVLGKAITGDDPRYIVAACEPCNLHIGDPQTHDPHCPLCTQPTIRTDW